MAKTDVSLGWAGVGKGGEAVYTSQDEPAMTKVLRRWSRKSRITGGLWEIPWAAGSECGQPSRSMPHLQSQFLYMKPSATLGLASPFMEP